jgi:hypothetical protein
MSQPIYPHQKVNRPRRRQGLWIAAAVVAAVAAAGCSSSPSPSPTVTATATETVTATPPGAAGGAATAGESIKGITFYRPSTVVSHSGDSAVLNSPDPVTKVTDYYVNLVNTGGWTVVSKSVTPDNGNLVIKKAGQGATIDISPSGTGSVITISTYPTG